jgi:hypothetical protein
MHRDASCIDGRALCAENPPSANTRSGLGTFAGVIVQLRSVVNDRTTATTR